MVAVEFYAPPPPLGTWVILLLFSVALFSAQTVFAQTFTGSDWSEFPGGAKAVCHSSNANNNADTDIDNDNDGLIEVCFVEDLNAIRYNLSGSGYKASASAANKTSGCPSNVCKGYELVRDLDFTDDDSYRNASANKGQWTTSTGFLPIGGIFNAIFEGNGYTLSNLRIVRPMMQYVGLFGRLSSNAHINGLGIVNVEMSGRKFVGSLVGDSEGTVTNSYNRNGQITGNDRQIGGLAGGSLGTITNSYNTASIEGKDDIGGIAGDTQNNATLSNTYNLGSVAGDADIGGLVGISNRAIIINSYNTGPISGPRTRKGGLVGADNARMPGGKVVNSYSSEQASDLIVGGAHAIPIINSTTVTTAELQAPTGPTGIYSTWSEDDWYFGTSTEYPILRYSTGTNVNYLACGESQQPTCGNTLRGQGIKLFAIPATTDVRITRGPAEGETVVLDATRAGATNYQWQYTGGASLILPTTNTSILRFSIPPDVALGSATTGLLALRLTVNDGTMDTQQTVQIVVNTVNDPPTVQSTDHQVVVTIGTTVNKQILVDVFEDLDGDPLRYTASGLPADSNLILSADGTLRTRGTSRVVGSATTNTASAVIVSVAASDGISTATTTFRLLFNAAPVITDIAPIATTEGEVVMIVAAASDANLDNLNYLWRATSGDKTASILAASLLSSATLVFTVPNDWANTTQAMLSLAFSVGDGATTSTEAVTVNITRVDNGDLTTALTITESDDRLTIATTVSIALVTDPDGGGTSPTYQWQICLADTNCSPGGQWRDISGATADSYQIPEAEAVGGNQFRVQLSYRDGQGYGGTAYSEVFNYRAKAVFVRLKLFLEGALQ